MNNESPCPTLCLNMIVKNESKIIVRLMESVVDLIDSYCICDTGSTDNTVELIQNYFMAKSKPGKIVTESFRDFGYNRSVSLKACESMDDVPETKGKNEYILLLDADMKFWVNPKLTPTQFKHQLIGDVYNVYQGTNYFFYKNTRIVKNRQGFTYWGVTHEYVKSPSNDMKYSQFERDVCFINDIGDGGCKTDKFLRDIKLLTKGLEDEPNNDRYTFYLANSYRDAGQFENAIETFKKRVKLGGWIEEVWYSLFSIGRCYKFLNDMPNAIYYWLEAYSHYPNRIENLYELIHYYRNNGKNVLAYTFFALADYHRKQSTKWDYLFLQKDIYDYKIDYEFSIVGYYCNRDNYNLIDTCMKVLAYPGADEGICKNVLSNYKFYTKDLQSYNLQGYNLQSLTSENLKVLQSIGKDKMQQFPEFVSSTPSICLNNHNGFTICVRYVNYKIDNDGKYINQNYIETKNIIATVNIQDTVWKIENEYELEYDVAHDNVYKGLEDVRLLKFNQDLIYSANRGLGSNNIVVELGKINQKTTNIPCQFLTYPTKRPIEKNWAIFESNNNTVNCIYKWSPITIGTISENSEFEITHEIQTPNFFQYMRGSTPGVIIGDEIWFINHIVSYESCRYYYHTIVVLDRNTYKLKKYTPLWTFEKSKVEYTLGMVYLSQVNQFLIGYSIMDRETKYIEISKTIFDDIMIGPKCE